MNIIRLSKEHIEECADLFIDVFTKAPWNDTYNSKGQVISYFQNYINNNYFVGYEHHFKKGQYSAAYSGFEGIEDNTDRIQTREEVEAEQSAGKTLANALKAAGVSRVDVVGIAESHCVKDTALDAKKLGFEVTVFEDLTVPVSEELGVAARKQMAAGGITLAESR